MKNKKTIFKSEVIRTLNTQEKYYNDKLILLLGAFVEETIITILPSFVSYDNKNRPLIINKDIIKKIENNHGKIISENVIITANDFDFIIKNVDDNKDKINLIKIIPNSPNFLTIGANRINGFFIVTYYESRPKKINTIKNLLLNKGDSLNHTGGAAFPSFATFL
jgi:hypothetical protein